MLLCFYRLLLFAEVCFPWVAMFVRVHHSEFTECLSQFLVALVPRQSASSVLNRCEVLHSCFYRRCQKGLLHFFLSMYFSCVSLCWVQWTTGEKTSCYEARVYASCTLTLTWTNNMATDIKTFMEEHSDVHRVAAPCLFWALWVYTLLYRIRACVCVCVWVGGCFRGRCRMLQGEVLPQDKASWSVKKEHNIKKY